MYVPVTTEDFDKWIKAESRTFETRCDVIIGNTTYRLSGSGLSGDIISMQWNNVVCSNDGLQIGTSCMDEFRMEYRNNNSIPSLMNSEIHPYVGLVIPHENTGDVTVWIPLGVFYVTNTESNDEDRTFSVTAYDGMQKLMGSINWTALQVEFPINAWTLLQTIADYFELTLTYDEMVYELLSSEEYTLVTSDGDTLVVSAEINANKNVSFTEGYEGTYRDYIGWIAGLVGANAHMGRTGDLVISRYTDHGMTIPRTLQHMGGTKINFGGSVTYTNIVSGTDENPVYATNYTGNAITYTNPYITVTELDRVCDELIGESGMTITPCDIQWRGDPRLDCGDIVQAEDKDGNYFPVYVMERVMNITGGLSETLHCYVETEVQKVLNKSPIVTKMTQIAKNSELTPAYIINNTEGTFQFIDNGDGTNGGFTIFETEDGNSWLRCTAGGLGISADGGLTYTNAITKNGVVATEINVVKDGATILDVGVDYNGLGYAIPSLQFNNQLGARAFEIEYSDYYKRSTLSMSDAVRGYDELVISMAVGRTGTMPSDGTGGFAEIAVSDPRDGRLGGMSAYLTYPDDDGFSRSTFTITADSTSGSGNFGRVMLASSPYTSGGVTYDNASIGIYDRTTGGEVMVMRDTGVASPSLFVRSLEYGLKSLTLRPIAINGTTYYILASTAV